MTERLISYSPEMVRAKRAGLKTMTRRVLHDFFPRNRPEFDSETGRLEWLSGDDVVCGMRCPYGKPGDILATREAWRTLAILDDFPPRDLRESAPIWYEADGPAPDWYDGRYRHARFMCRWMCRDRDEITAVRVERLGDLTESDARAEGVSSIAEFVALWKSINGTWEPATWIWVLQFRKA